MNNNLEENAEFIGRLGVEIRNGLINEWAIIDLLVEKGIITKEEYNKKRKVIFDQYWQKINNYLATGDGEILKE